tara:strand:- start:887 stop:1153 length:267 start_codon:yes stop_codon:yes gene_type:complete
MSQQASTINKLSDLDLAIIKDMVDSEHNAVSKLGLIEYDIVRLNEEKTKLVTLIKQLSEAKNKKLKDLEEKYGPGGLNIDTGEFTSRR